MEQLLAHLVGDYVLQSQWMADNKRRSYRVAFIHALCYTLPFVAIGASPRALSWIMVTHLLIDHFGLARLVIYAKNWLLNPRLWLAVYREWEFFKLGPNLRADMLELQTMTGSREREDRTAILRNSWLECREFGFPKSVPPLLALILLIVTDNTIHLVINYIAMRLFP